MRDAATSGSACLDVVLGALLDEADALEDICDVVDAPLLHAKHRRRLVEVQHALLSGLDERHKLLGQQAEAAVITAGLRLGHRSLQEGRGGTGERAVPRAAATTSVGGEQSSATIGCLKINKDKTLPDVRLPVVSDDFQPTHVVLLAPNKKV